jgi:hypothetical protein
MPMVPVFIRSTGVLINNIPMHTAQEWTQGVDVWVRGHNDIQAICNGIVLHGAVYYK